MNYNKAHIQWHGMNIMYILDDIKVSRDEDYHTSPYVGEFGSTTNHVSSGGRVISFKSLCLHDEPSRHDRPHRINDYIALAENYKGKVKVLTSESSSNLDGNYMMTGFEYTENTMGDYEISWEFTEDVKFNVVNKTFRVWGKAKKATTTTKKKTTTKTSSTSNLNSNIKYLLKSCGTMSASNTKKKCVTSLQKFLQSQGYYKGYKLDGLYQKYTTQAVKNLQKKYKLKVTGKWDKNTRQYFQKKYKYPPANKSKETLKVWSDNKRVNVNQKQSVGTVTQA